MEENQMARSGRVKKWKLFLYFTASTREQRNPVHKAVTPYFLVSCPLLKGGRNGGGIKSPTFARI
jgi:hypothetical protein